MKDLTRRTLAKSLVCGFLLTIAAVFFPFAASCEELPQNVLRLHVIANSDSPEDQAVKLKVRDAVLREASRWYEDARTMEEANSAVCTHLESITAAAREVLLENGVRQTAAAEVTEMYFTTREYENFSLPAGKYRTLRVTIGSGEGKNWWCVVFPALCLPAAEQRQDDVLAALPDSQQELVKHPGKYRVKFKAVEWYQELCSFFDR